MSDFKRLLRKYKLDYADFNTWADKAQSEAGQRKRLFDAYDRSLRNLEIAQSDVQTWIMRHFDDADFEVRYKAKGDKLSELERLSVALLERIFIQYRKDVGDKR
jgi:hypothetical protein